MEQIKGYTKASFPEGSVIHKVSESVQARIQEIYELVMGDDSLSEVDKLIAIVFFANSSEEDFYYSTLKEEISVEDHEKGFKELIQQLCGIGLDEEMAFKSYAEVFVSDAFDHSIKMFTGE